MSRLTDIDVSEETWRLYFLLRGMRDYPFSLRPHWEPVIGSVWTATHGVMLLPLKALPMRDAAEYLTNAQFTALVERFYPSVLQGPARKPMGRFNSFVYREKVSA